MRGLPSTVSFGITQGENWNAKHHRNATIYPDNKLPNGITAHVPHKAWDIVAKDPFAKHNIVYGRWVSLVSRGTNIDPGTSHTSELWQYRILEPSQTTIHQQIYYSSYDMKDHRATLKGKFPEDGLKPYIERWCAPLKMELPDLLGLGFQYSSYLGKKKYIELYYRVVLECTGANMVVKLQIAAPGTQPFGEDGEPCQSKVVVVAESSYELASEEYNTFPRVQGAVGMAGVCVWVCCIAYGGFGVWRTWLEDTPGIALHLFWLDLHVASIESVGIIACD